MASFLSFLSRKVQISAMELFRFFPDSFQIGNGLTRYPMRSPVCCLFLHKFVRVKRLPDTCEHVWEILPQWYLIPHATVATPAEQPSTPPAVQTAVGGDRHRGSR